MKAHWKFSAFGLLFYALNLFLGSATVEAASSAQKVVITFAAFSERSGFLFIANDQRFFEEQGLDARIVQVRSAPVAMSALAAGEAHFYTAGASGTSLGAMAGGLDVVFIAGLINKLDGYFVVSPKIQSPADLKGRVLGVSSMGGGIWAFTMVSLDHWGLDPERDKIQFRVIGDDSVIAQAITTGVVDGAYLAYTFSKIVERQGFRVLADLSKIAVPYQVFGVLARRSFVDRFPEITEKTLRAMGKAVAFIEDPANKGAVVRSLAKWLRLPRLEGAEELYERMTGLYDRRLLPSREGLRNALRVLGKVNPKIGQLELEDLVDDRIVRELEKKGGF